MGIDPVSSDHGGSSVIGSDYGGAKSTTGASARYESTTSPNGDRQIGGDIRPKWNSSTVALTSPIGHTKRVR
mgnify:CR=1 FL=1|jgi:hypothetical protein